MDSSVVKKVCFKCKEEKRLSEFYRHKQMGDGHLNKCKECTKRDVTEHRVENIEKIRAYDRARGKLPHRIQGNTERTKQYRKMFPDKYRAHSLLARARKTGRVIIEPCVVCGTTERLEAHHEDYSKPLDVVWLCSVHHHAVHHKGLVV